MISSNQSPLNSIGEDPRNRLILACHGKGIGSVPVINKFDSVVSLLDSARLETQPRLEAISTLSGIFQNFVEAGSWKLLEDVPFSRGLRDPGVEDRLKVALGVSQLLTLSRVSVREESLREQIVGASVREIFREPLMVGPLALSEIDTYLKLAPMFIDRIIEFERAQGALPENKDCSPADIRFVYRADEMAVANLKLLICNDMPAKVAMTVTECLIKIQKQSLRDEVIDGWKWFAHSSTCASAFDDLRLPEPMGRSALVAAIKYHDGIHTRYEQRGPRIVQQLPVTLPSNPAHWRYLAQRLFYLSKIKDEEQRDLRMSAYVRSFREYVASHPFFEEEERHFRRMNLEGKSPRESLRFYSSTYGVDNGPGPEGSELALKPLRETERAFRFMAAARYGLNIRKGYTRTIKDTGAWLLEHMAEELKGSSNRYTYTDIEAYPGSGIRISGLDLRNALDLSTRESRYRHLRASPWIGTSLRVGGEVEYHLTRGFKAVCRTLEAASAPLSETWRARGCHDGEPYSAIIFNDHFHNDRLPEVRAWLVPERALHRKLELAIRDKVDINKLDITPEGISEDADSLGLPIFDVGCSCARWGSFANAWPFGFGPAHAWEVSSDWAYSRWQSPRHIHRAMSGESYSDQLRMDVAMTMLAAREAHEEIHRMVQFFLDLHSSFLTMEEAWAKGYASSAEDPAQEERPQEQEQSEPSASGGSEEQRGDDEVPDLQVRRPRTRMLEHFLQLRNQIVSTKRGLSAKDLPSLELQYTRLFARQAKTPFISGADMMMVFPDGSHISLLGAQARRGEVTTKIVEMNEQMEALWEKYIVSEFAPNNCPRIILP